MTALYQAKDRKIRPKEAEPARTSTRYLHPLKFVEACAINGVQMEGVQLSSPACQECLVAFQDNVRRVIGLAAVQGWSSLAMAQWSEAGTRAAYEVLGSEYWSKMADASRDQVSEIAKKSDKFMGEIVTRDSADLARHLEHWTRTTEQIAMRYGPYIHGLFEGTLKSVCIQAWTSLEVLFEELHTKVMDLHRACFAEINRTKKFRFRRLADIRAAYDRAFSRNTEICSILSHHSIDALAEVRHNLVHKSGVADVLFVSAVPQLPLLSAFASLKAGDSLGFRWGSGSFDC